jgi:hypothetical protein
MRAIMVLVMLVLACGCINEDMTKNMQRKKAFDSVCEKDDDCQLINRNHGFACCWTGRCDSVDYSRPEWVAVNSAWFGKQQYNNCPTKDKCGPAPICDKLSLNVRFSARCLDKICTKSQNS